MPDQPTNPPGQFAGDPRTRRYVLILVAVALIIAIWGIVSRLNARNALEKQAGDAGVATVTTVKPHGGPGKDTLVLPGSVQAFYEAPIYARTSGYLKIWHTDIGTPVKKGQLLAEIETPEVDQELRQAQADLATAQANYELARTTNERWKGLLATESVSQQDADQRAGDAAAKAAAKQSAAANLARACRSWNPFKSGYSRPRTACSSMRSATPMSGPSSTPDRVRATRCSASPICIGCASTYRCRSCTPLPSMRA